MRFYSEDFLAQLEPGERSQFAWRRVERRGRGKKVFYELGAPGLRVPFVAVSEEAGALWRVPGSVIRKGSELSVCATCAWSTGPFYPRSSERLPFWYVSAADLPDPPPTCFAVGGVVGYDLCVTRQRWQELVGRPGTRGIASSEVGVVAPSLVDTHPPTRPL